MGRTKTIQGNKENHVVRSKNVVFVVMLAA